MVIHGPEPAARPPPRERAVRPEGHHLIFLAAGIQSYLSPRSRRLAVAVTCEAQSCPGAIDLSSRGRDPVLRPPLSERTAHPGAQTRRLRNPGDGIQLVFVTQSMSSGCCGDLRGPPIAGGEAAVGPLDSEQRQSGGHGRRRPRAPGHRPPTRPTRVYALTHSGLEPCGLGRSVAAVGSAPRLSDRRHARRAHAPGSSSSAGGLGARPGGHCAVVTLSPAAGRGAQVQARRAR